MPQRENKQSVSPGRRTPLLLSLAVFLVALAATYGTWQMSQQQLTRYRQAEFDFQVRQTQRRIEERMATYAQVQRGVQAFLLGSMDVKRDDFRLYVASLRLEDMFPGIQGIALAPLLTPAQVAPHVAAMRASGVPYEVHPAGARPLYSAISHIEPFTGLNPRALGFDMLTEPNRRAAMERARDSGRVSASAKVRLIQENGRDPQAGLVMYLPVYRRGMPTATLEERRAHHIGWVGAPFRMNDLMAGLGGERFSDVILSIYDGATARDEALLYDSHAGAAARHRPMFQETRLIVIAGRPWTLDVRSAPVFEARLQSDRPRLIATVGVVGSVMVALLVWILATGRGRALALARNMTQQLGESEFRWKYALEGAGDGVWDGNSVTGEVVYSARWREMLGYAMADIRNAPEEWERLLHPDDRERVFATFQAYLNSASAPYQAEYRMLCKDGGWKWILARGAAVTRDAAGLPVRTIGTHTDITRAKENEHQLRETNERLAAEQRRLHAAQRLEAERTLALEQTRNALQHAQKLEAVGKLTGGIAHDFNNVLHVIGGNIQLLQLIAKGNERIEERLKRMQSVTDRGAKLSSQLLAFARRQPLQPRVLDPGAILLDMDDLLQRAVGDAVRVRVEAGDGVWNSLVDPGQLENVIVNLAINGRDAMPEGGVLTIALANATLDTAAAHALVDVAAGDYVRLTVTDTGGGMPPDVMAMAFEPFFTTKPVGQGTGLGLSMAYGFVKQSGGHIHLESAPGEGTTVVIYLPRSMANADQPAAAAEESAEGGSETILVVEDDAEVRQIAINTLTELGYTVLDAEDGERALAIVRGGIAIDLLFTDVVMPGPVSSTELAALASAMLPRMAVLFTSGYTRNALTSKGRLQEGVQLLSKPYRREQLAQRVREALARRGDHHKS
ncbi:CHASE domain-containing protein [Pseudoduganella namucuonensis]|uniref:histidine kinase n=1 Tax=Pseudoduganella namucuonensis TaxID=1035707 RepID=A0A1I7II61_9BURK|nr:CHASE domain-containing protein [Pseudoduganella namucuonensis]SFU72607.1 PAS domain S-box-containing protein [Pseudoduganella namucuonensis]